MTKVCPKCKDVLANEAESCSCGWIAASATLAGAMAEGVARNNASIESRVLAEAKAYCAAKGLDTREKQMAFIKKTLRSPKFMRPDRQREPGDDDEALPA